MSSIGERLTFEGGRQNLKYTAMFEERPATPRFIPVPRPVNRLCKSVILHAEASFIYCVGMLNTYQLDS